MIALKYVQIFIWCKRMLIYPVIRFLTAFFQWSFSLIFCSCKSDLTRQDDWKRLMVKGCVVNRFDWFHSAFLGSITRHSNKKGLLGMFWLSADHRFNKIYFLIDSLGGAAERDLWDQHRQWAVKLSWESMTSIHFPPHHLPFFHPK